jgi:hypothetical protein
MAEPKAKEEGQTPAVKVDGENAVLHITDQSVMFEKGGRVSGFLRSAIQLVKPDGDAMLIAYSAGSEVKSVRVEPITAVAPLLIPPNPRSPTAAAAAVLAGAAALDEVFERMYTEARTELRERLAKIEADPENKSLRLTLEEEKRYALIWEQMRGMVGVKYGFDPDAPGNSIGFYGLEKEPYERQLDSIKTLYIWFLIDITGPGAETADVDCSNEDIWPEEWERINDRFGLEDGPIVTEKYKNYLYSKWTAYHRGNVTPPLARP